MWVGDTVYFLVRSQRHDQSFLLRAAHEAVTQLTRHDDFDIMTASAGPDAIVYEQAGYIHLVDAETRKADRLTIEVDGRLPWARPQFKRVAA